MDTAAANAVGAQSPVSAAPLNGDWRPHLHVPHLIVSTMPSPVTVTRLGPVPLKVTSNTDLSPRVTLSADRMALCGYCRLMTWATAGGSASIARLSLTSTSSPVGE